MEPWGVKFHPPFHGAHDLGIPFPDVGQWGMTFDEAMELAYFGASDWDGWCYCWKVQKAL